MANRLLILAVLFPVTCPVTWAQGTTSDPAASAMASDANASSLGAWTTGGPYGGPVLALAINPTTPATLYAGTHRGVFKSTNSGATWAANPGMTNVNVNALAI